MKVYLLGAANPEAVRMILTLKRSQPDVQFAFLDNDPAKQGTLFHGVPVVGGTDKVTELKGPDTRFVNLITGSTALRYRTTCEIVEAGGTLGNFIHPGIDLTMITMGVGTYLQEGVIMQAQVCLGDNTSISAGCVVGHEGRSAIRCSWRRVSALPVVSRSATAPSSAPTPRSCRVCASAAGSPSVRVPW